MNNIVFNILSVRLQAKSTSQKTAVFLIFFKSPPIKELYPLLLTPDIRSSGCFEYNIKEVLCQVNIERVQEMLSFTGFVSCSLLD